ncbi:hypothetical protein HID58_040718 [Brassica napus]|uniref:Cyclic nucleotide-binding domain-containing protein n=1 Tax=Brassica napus TaxID=3708 RepID=A0ABQ8B8U9_BRANA|nr:hypothetical protein HID58_040718 [Brassica napus]
MSIPIPYDDPITTTGEQSPYPAPPKGGNTTNLPTKILSKILVGFIMIPVALTALLFILMSLGFSVFFFALYWFLHRNYRRRLRRHESSDGLSPRCVKSLPQFKFCEATKYGSECVLGLVRFAGIGFKIGRGKDKKEPKEAIWAVNDPMSKSYKLSLPSALKPPDNLLAGNRINCDSPLYDARQQQWANVTNVFKLCDARKGEFKYGMFENAITKKVVSSNFNERYFYCLWWGLQQLSSYGQNLSTTTFIGETTFAVLIAIFGLVLFAHLIGNMQTYLQSLTVRLEEWRLKKRDTEEWMRHRQLPEDLRDRVRRYEQYKWLAARGVDEEVPFFSQMDDQLLDAICERLVSSLCTEGTYLVREGDLITEMLFIIRGRLESSTTNGGRTGFFNSIILRPGDFCGEELLSWALLPKSTLNLPSSTRTVRALVEVEAFALRAEDLKFVANQFRRLHSKKLQHTFRFYSHHWRTWAACFIQAAWRRYKRRAMENHLTAVESKQSDEEEEEEVVVGKVVEEEEEGVGSSPKTKMNIGVMVLASRFAANTRRGVAAQRVKDVEMPRFKKPEEPDFSAEPDD